MKIMARRIAKWRNQPIRLYHGTLASDARSVIQRIQVSRGAIYRDFGRGFYTTTDLRQAAKWANHLAQAQNGAKAAVVELVLDRDRLAELDCLAFVRGDENAHDFWSFVRHCREGRTAHGSRGYYDVVVGPVAAFWEQRYVIQGCDQVSFHTPRAERFLNSSARASVKLP